MSHEYVLSSMFNLCCSSFLAVHEILEHRGRSRSSGEALMRGLQEPAAHLAECSRHWLNVTFVASISAVVPSIGYDIAIYKLSSNRECPTRPSCCEFSPAAISSLEEQVLEVFECIGRVWSSSSFSVMSMRSFV
jgi:hypothetical protein